MRQAFVAVAAAAALVLGLGATGVTADPGPHHGNNGFGLCTAHENGNGGDNGKKNEAGPFAALQEAADAAGDEGQTVTEWCADNAPHPGGR